MIWCSDDLMIWCSDDLMFWWSATWPSPHLSTAVAQHARKMVGKKVRKEVEEIILNLFRHSKPERGGNILDQGFISLDAQDSIGSTSQNWWPTKPTPHVSRLLPPHSQVTHWSMLATKVLSRNHTRLGQPTSLSRRWKSLKRRRAAVRQQAGNRWQQQQAESQEPQGERCRWLLRLTRAASSPTGEPSLPLANTKVV